MSHIFEAFLSTPEVLEAFSERQFVDAMLRYEAALARAQAACGLIPLSAAEAIIAACKVNLIDVKRVVDESGRAGSVAIPFIKNLKQTVALSNESAVKFIHFGSTSQDVIDTALALVSKPALAMIVADARTCASALLAHAHTYAATPMLARTLMQPASVTSFGLKCLHWAAPLVRSVARIEQAMANALCVQFGGAVGTSAALAGQATRVTELVAAELGLRAPEACWHTERDLWVLLGCELGILTGCLGKIAQDIALLGQFEVAEVSEPAEPGRGGSTAMPHKRNPVAAMIGRSAAQRVPQRVAALLASMSHEHERALGGWQTELAEWPGLLISTHGAARALAGALPGLEIDAARMLRNLQAVAAQLPPAAAAEWFAPALADQAALLVESELPALQAQLIAQSA